MKTKDFEIVEMCNGWVICMAGTNHVVWPLEGFSTKEECEKLILNEQADYDRAVINANDY